MRPVQLGVHVATHCPAELHASVPLHVPHGGCPGQPPSPHIWPEQSWWHVNSHCPTKLQIFPVGHVPHEPPQPSSAHTRVPQLGVQPTHCPAVHVLAKHAPQVP